VLYSLLHVAPAQAISSLADAGGQEGQQQSFWKSMLAADPVTQKQKDMKARLDLLLTSQAVVVEIHLHKTVRHYCTRSSRPDSCADRALSPRNAADSACESVKLPVVYWYPRWCHMLHMRLAVSLTTVAPCKTPHPSPDVSRRCQQMAKLAARRMIMQRLRRTPDQHSEALAQANAVRPYSGIACAAASVVMVHSDALKSFTYRVPALLLCYSPSPTISPPVNTACDTFFARHQSHKSWDEAPSLPVVCDLSWKRCVTRHARLQMVLTQAARGLIRGDAGPSPAADAADDGGRIAALLCFDEMQITDVFTAVALKGALAVSSTTVTRNRQNLKSSCCVAGHELRLEGPPQSQRSAMMCSGGG